MRVYELMRKVVVEPLTIRLWIDANDGACEHCVDHADTIAEAVRNMTCGDEEPMVLAEQIANTFLGVNAVEVLGEDGDGGLVYPNWP